MRGGGYAVREIFSEDERALLDTATRMVRRCPYEIDGELVRCHELVRAVGMLLALDWTDGWFGMCEHSWLWTKPRRELEPLPNVLDVYALGRLPQVQLVNTSISLPFEYRRGDLRRGRQVRAGAVDQLLSECAKWKEPL